LCSDTDENIYAILAEVLIKVRLLGYHQRHANTVLQILRRLKCAVVYTPLKKNLKINKTQCDSEREGELYSENVKVSKLIFDQ